MNLETCNWNQTYTAFLNYLGSLQDLKYRDFHGKLIQDTNTLIGIRTPILKKIAITVSKNKPYDFLKCVQHDTYEERIIHGLVIGYLKIPFGECISLLNDFLPFNNNWAINDIVCSNLKIWKDHLEEGLDVIRQYVVNQNGWIRRFGLVLLLNYYINDTYIDSILELCSKVPGDEYYVGMANAWLLSLCYIHYPQKVVFLLEHSILDHFTQKHTIQKIIESTRVSSKDKEQMRRLREHLGKSLI